MLNLEIQSPAYTPTLESHTLTILAGQLQADSYEPSQNHMSLDLPQDFAAQNDYVMVIKGEALNPANVISPQLLN